MKLIVLCINDVHLMMVFFLNLLEKIDHVSFIFFYSFDFHSDFEVNKWFMELFFLMMLLGEYRLKTKILEK